MAAPSLFPKFLGRFLRETRSLPALAILALILVLAAGAPVIAPYHPLEQDLLHRLAPPSREHILGTDGLGRDILSRLIFGARYSLLIAIGAVVIGTSVGVVAGLSAGYFGGRVDTLVSRVTEVLMAFPGLLLALVFVTILGPGLMNVFLAIGINASPHFMRISRIETMAIKRKEFVEAAVAIGAGHWHIITRHIFLNLIPSVMVLASLRIGHTLLTAASLGFLGLGLPPDLPEWGTMLNHARGYMRTTPYAAISPGIAITLTVLALNWIGDGLRDFLDPRLRSRGAIRNIGG